VPVHTDEAEFNLAERMVLRGYEDTTCPLINETRYYDFQTPQRLALAKELNATLVRWLLEKESELEFDHESGIIMEVAPPIVTSLTE
jgi:hypothetical protein